MSLAEIIMSAVRAWATVMSRPAPRCRWLASTLSADGDTIRRRVIGRLAFAVSAVIILVRLAGALATGALRCHITTPVAGSARSAARAVTRGPAGLGRVADAAAAGGAPTL